jgi:hypothetical protein
MAKLGFKDFLTVDYAPGMPDQVKKNAKKRKMDTPTGNTNEEAVDEALTQQQRRARSRQLKKYQSRIKIGQERAKRRIASPEKLKKRARKTARDQILKKITKDVPKSELTYARRQEIEKRLDTPASKAKIERLAKKLFPKIRQAEMSKKRGGAKNND